MNKNILHIFSQLTLFHYTLFSLPIALVGAIMPFGDVAFASQFHWHEQGMRIVWLIVAAVSARNSAMALNRLIDAKIDALNPRTQQRAIPQGIISTRAVFLFAMANILLFLIASWQINQLCALMATIIIVLIVLYSYAKRFTSLRHFILALIQALAPFCGWIAITDTFAPAPIYLGIAIFCWMSGKDIIYSMQDVEFQKKQGLYGLPVLLGKKRCLQIARALHLAMPLFLLIANHSVGLPFWYNIGVFSVTVLLLYQHILLAEQEMQGLSQTFFLIDVWVPLSFFTCTLIAALSKNGVW